MGARLDRRGFGPPVCRGLSASNTTRPNFDKELGTAAMFFNKLHNPLRVVLFDPINHEAVGRQQAQHGAVIDGLKRANPGIELLLGKVGL